MVTVRANIDQSVTDIVPPRGPPEPGQGLGLGDLAQPVQVEVDGGGLWEHGRALQALVQGVRRVEVEAQEQGGAQDREPYEPAEGPEDVSQCELDLPGRVGHVPYAAADEGDGKVHPLEVAPHHRLVHELHLLVVYL